MFRRGRTIDTPISACTTERGFTLMEMLVVMLLTAMITAVLFQGLQQVIGLQKRFGAELYDTQQGAMIRQWFRRVINGLLPDYPNGRHLFRGEAKSMTGLTLTSLMDEPGQLLPFTWRIRFDPLQEQSQLTYGKNSSSQVILSWPGRSGHFSYYDQQGNAHDTWPPPFGDWPQIPAVIELHYESDGLQQVIVAAPQTLGPLPLRLKDLEKNF